MPLDPLTIVFALVAIAVIWKLRSVLGERSGAEKPPRRDLFTDPPQGRSRVSPPRPGETGKVIELPGAARPPTPDPDRWRDFAEPGSPASAGLDAISAADPAFSPGPFLEGAKIAYEAIITAFAAGERKTLQSLLASDVYDGFNAAILERQKRNETLTTTFVSIDDAKIDSATMEGRQARVSARFLSKQISATHGANGSLTDGSTDRVVDMDDIWTFARDTTSHDPNWKLVATQSGH